MRSRTRLSPELNALVVAQAGVISRGQLLHAGLTARGVDCLISQAFLHVITPGIYARMPDIGFVGKAWAGILLGGQRAVIGGQAAGFLHGLRRDEPSSVTVFSPRHLVDRPCLLFVRSTRAGTGEPPRTDYDATTIDLCAELDEDGVAAVLADAISSGKTTPKRLAAEIEQRSRLRNGALLREALGDAAAGVHSALERRYLVEVERPHGLPIATRQAHAHAKHRADGWYEKHRVLVELDSKLHHTGGAAFRDMTRDNDHAALGIVTLRIGWGHVTGTNACETAHQIGGVLIARGWEGPVGTCKRCRLVPARK